jgi:hypothetical protein
VALYGQAPRATSCGALACWTRGPLRRKARSGTIPASQLRFERASEREREQRHDGTTHWAADATEIRFCRPLRMSTRAAVAKLIQSARPYVIKGV